MLVEECEKNKENTDLFWYQYFTKTDFCLCYIVRKITLMWKVILVFMLP